MAKPRNARKGKKKKASATVDFDGVESGGRSISDGWAHGRIKEAELTTSSNDNEMFALTWEVTRGKEKAIAFDQVVLTPNALWKLKQLLESCGVDVPESEMEVSEEDLVDLECEVEIINEEYEGKDRPKISGFRPINEEEEESEDEEEEEDEKPKKKGKKKPSKDEDEEEEEEDDDSDDEEEEESDDDEEEDDDDEEEEEEEEEEKPKKKKKGKPKLRAGMKVSFKDDKKKMRQGVITSIDDDTIYVEDSKEGEWELSIDEIELV